MNRVAGACEYSQLHLQLVVPFHLLLVVVVCLKHHSGDKRIVALTTFIPVVGDIVLLELQTVVAFESPEIRLQNNNFRLRHGWGLFPHYHISLWLAYGCCNHNWLAVDRRGHAIDCALLCQNKVRTIEIDIEKHIVEQGFRCGDSI